MLESLKEYWPILPVLAPIIWKQISDHFDQKNIRENLRYQKEKVLKLEGKMEAIEKDLTGSIKEQNDLTSKNFDAVNKSLTELIRATTRLTTQFEMSQIIKPKTND
jgi:hypothetical protein